LGEVTDDGHQVGALLHTLPAKQSSVHNFSTMPGFTLRTGTAPLIDQAYSVLPTSGQDADQRSSPTRSSTFPAPQT